MDCGSKHITDLTYQVPLLIPGRTGRGRVDEEMAALVSVSYHLLFYISHLGEIMDPLKGGVGR